MVLKRLALLVLCLALAVTAGAQQTSFTPASISASFTATTCTGTPGTGTGCVVLNVSGFASVSIQLSGFGAATVQFEASDDGVTYTALNMTPPNSTSAVTSATANGLWVGSVGGLKYVRVRASAYTSGTIVATIQAAQSGGGGGGGGGGAASSVTINDPGTPAQKAAVNASGQLSITCANCSGSGASAVDNSAFVAGATSGAPAMGFYHSTIDTVTDGDTATVAIDSKRNQFFVVRDAAGNARGANVTAGNALTTDSSATTQPVSGTFWQATQPVSGTFWQATQPVSGTFWQATQPVSGTVTANQGGTWTVQPGNTANTTAWKVDGSAVTQPVSGTVTANQGTAAAATAPWPASAGTVAEATASWTSGTALNTAISINTTGLATFIVGMTGTPNAGTGAVTAEGSDDGGTTWLSIYVNQFDSSISRWSSASAVIDLTSGTPTTRFLSGFCAGLTNVRLRLSTVISSNTFTLRLGGSAAPIPAGVNALPMALVTVGGISVATGSGNGSSATSGTQRVILATDQPNLTSALNVALAANQSVNVAQVNGVTTTTGAGATGTGVQRVNDVASAATGAAPPAAAQYIGGLISGATGGFLGGITVCDLSKVINVSTATTTLMVTGVSGRQVRICSFHMITTLANNVAWLEGTGATCGTGTAGMAGGTTAASGYNFAANAGMAVGTGLGEVLTTATTGDSVCLITSAATQLSGFIKYTIY